MCLYITYIFICGEYLLPIKVKIKVMGIFKVPTMASCSSFFLFSEHVVLYALKYMIRI